MKWHDQVRRYTVYLLHRHPVGAPCSGDAVLCTSTDKYVGLTSKGLGERAMQHFKESQRGVQCGPLYDRLRATKPFQWRVTAQGSIRGTLRQAAVAEARTKHSVRMYSEQPVLLNRSTLKCETQAGFSPTPRGHSTRLSRPT